MKVRVLGCSGAIAKDCRTTSFLIGDSILLDAGTGVGDLTLEGIPLCTAGGLPRGNRGPYARLFQP